MKNPALSNAFFFLLESTEIRSSKYSDLYLISTSLIDNSCNKYVTQETKDNLKKYIEEYNTIANMTPSEDWLVNMHMENAKYEKWMKVLSNTPLGLELFMRVSTNYKQLQTIYYQRKNHRLKDDWGAFIKFIEKLPYFKELILGES